MAEFYLYWNDRVQGPYKAETVRQKITSTRLNIETPCCPVGEQEWQKIYDFTELSGPYEHRYDEQKIRLIFRIPQIIDRAWVASRIMSLTPTIETHERIINTAAVPSSVIISSNSIMDMMSELLIYQRLGFKTITPTPDVVIADLLGFKDERITSCLKRAFKAKKNKLIGLFTAKAKANSLLKLLGMIEYYQAEFEDKELITPLKSEVTALAQNLRLDAEMESVKALLIQSDHAKTRNKIAKILAWARDIQVDAEFQRKVDDLEKRFSAK
jgi:hypothetical protein